MTRERNAGGGPVVCGIGIDVVDTERVARLWRRQGWRFARRILHEHETAPLRDGRDPVRYLGEAFALKEAVLKALGTGWALGLTFRQIERRAGAVGRDSAAAVRLHGAARARAAGLGVRRMLASTSSDERECWAVVVLEGRPSAGVA